MVKIVAEGNISQKTTGEPKIYLGRAGERISVTIDLYKVTPNDLMALTSRPLKITLEPTGVKIGVPYSEDDEDY